MRPLPGTLLVTWEPKRYRKVCVVIGWEGTEDDEFNIIVFWPDGMKPMFGRSSMTYYREA